MMRKFKTIHILTIAAIVFVIIMLMAFQTAVQLVSGACLPIPAIIAESAIFTLPGMYAAILAGKLYKTIEEGE